MQKMSWFPGQMKVLFRGAIQVLLQNSKLRADIKPIIAFAGGRPSQSTSSNIESASAINAMQYVRYLVRRNTWAYLHTHKVSTYNNVCVSICEAKIWLEHSIFIFVAQRTRKERNVILISVEVATRTWFNATNIKTEAPYQNRRGALDRLPVPSACTALPDAFSRNKSPNQEPRTPGIYCQDIRGPVNSERKYND